MLATHSWLMLGRPATVLTLHWATSTLLRLVRERRYPSLWTRALELHYPLVKFRTGRP